jgi:hypothetical protein
MRHKLKYLLLGLLLYSISSFACVIGPKQITLEPTVFDEYEFSVKTEKSQLCEKCSYISITAPERYLQKPFSHGALSVWFNESLVSRSVHSSISDKGVPEFGAVINEDEGYTYEVTFDYGTSRCMSFEFLYTGTENAS